MNARRLHHLTIACTMAIVALLWSPTTCLSGEKALDTATIERLTEEKGEFSEKEGVFKVSVPRSDLDITVAGVKMTPPLGLTSWAAFQKTGEQVMVMGDLVMFYLGYPEIDPLVEQSGFMEEAETIRRVNHERGKAEALALISERMLESLAIYGEAQHCRAQLEELIGAGLDVPIIRVSNVPYAEREKKEVFLRAIDSLRNF